MSLDVYLTNAVPQPKQRGSGIFVRDSGSTREISREEWDEKFPDREPVVFNDESETTNQVYHANITHNLGKMANKAGIYDALWRPDEIGITKASQLIEPLTVGLAKLKGNPEHYKQFDSPNGWGLYVHFVPFVEKYLAACQDYPNADVSVSR